MYLKCVILLTTIYFHIAKSNSVNDTGSPILLSANKPTGTWTGATSIFADTHQAVDEPNKVVEHMSCTLLMKKGDDDRNIYVDLLQYAQITLVRLYFDINCCQEPYYKVFVRIGLHLTSSESYTECGYAAHDKNMVDVHCVGQARVVQVIFSDIAPTVEICELEVFGYAGPPLDTDHKFRMFQSNSSIGCEEVDRKPVEKIILYERDTKVRDCTNCKSIFTTYKREEIVPGTYYHCKTTDHGAENAVGPAELLKYTFHVKEIIENNIGILKCEYTGGRPIGSIAWYNAEGRVQKMCKSEPGKKCPMTLTHEVPIDDDYDYNTVYACEIFESDDNYRFQMNSGHVTINPQPSILIDINHKFRIYQDNRTVGCEEIDRKPVEKMTLYKGESVVKECSNCKRVFTYYNREDIVPGTSYNCKTIDKGAEGTAGPDDLLAFKFDIKQSIENGVATLRCLVTEGRPVESIVWYNSAGYIQKRCKSVKGNQCPMSLDLEVALDTNFNYDTEYSCEIFENYDNYRFQMNSGHVKIKALPTVKIDPNHRFRIYQDNSSVGCEEINRKYVEKMTLYKGDSVVKQCSNCKLISDRYSRDKITPGTFYRCKTLDKGGEGTAGPNELLKYKFNIQQIIDKNIARLICQVSGKRPIANIVWYNAKGRVQETCRSEHDRQCPMSLNLEVPLGPNFNYNSEYACEIFEKYDNYRFQSNSGHLTIRKPSVK